MKTSQMVTISIFSALLLIVSVVAFVPWQKQENAKVVQQTSHVFQLPPEDARVVAFGAPFTSASQEWMRYVNTFFDFSMDIPPGMETRHTVGIIEQDGMESIKYHIEFSSTASSSADQRHIAIVIERTDATSTHSYARVHGYGEDTGYRFDTMSMTGIPLIAALYISDFDMPQKNVHERHVFGLKNGYGFDIDFDVLTISDYERILKSVRL